MEPTPLFEPDALPRVISRAAALERGMSRHAIDRRVASGRWRRLLPATYCTGDTITEVDRYRAALAFAGSDAALSGAAALRVSEIGKVAVPATVLVLVPRDNRRRSAGWVCVRRSQRRIDLEQWVGPRRVCVARAAADHALTLRRIDDVRALVARVVRDGRCTLDELAQELATGPRRDSALLRQALEEVGLGAASAPEARAAALMRRARLPAFEQNARIDLPGGRYYVADFLWRRLRAVLEIDSREHHFEPADWADTQDRHLELTTVGYSVVHRPPSSLRDEAAFLAGVSAWLHGRAADLRRGLS
jgi:very-short-patch-repair endonuclease